MSFRKQFRAASLQEGKARRARRQTQQTRTLIKQGITWMAIAVFAGGVIGYITSTGEDGRPRGPAMLSKIGSNINQPTAKGASSTYFAYCDQARAAGKAPIYAGQPGYRSGLDADGDGIACERYPR